MTFGTQWSLKVSLQPPNLESHVSKKVCSVIVAGKKMPNMTTEMELQVLQSALFTFDLIESVLARVEELIEAKTKVTTEGTAGVK
ncbi:hypothetical protein lerEdw1_007564 [Lerista edwardsae]|nr:hypothetical protein lerEdw1_007565 [Lerista edwardsae]KAJ6650470.1 hypothetical protein lerEdw1_007564 [Lerista edwardsae]